MKVKCPRCGTPTEFEASNKSRPFCSERCKLIDLGAWASESYAIPVKPAAEADDNGDEESPIDVDSYAIEAEDEESPRSKH